MQPCNRIYYSTVHWRLNMFRVAYRSSSGAVTVLAASGLHMHVVTSHSQVWVGTPTQWEFPLRLDYGRSPHAYVNQRLQVWVGTPTQWEFPLRLDYGRSPHAYVNQRPQVQLELLMMSGMPLETCSAFNDRWNNKFYYKVASCWLFLLSEDWPVPVCTVVSMGHITGDLNTSNYCFTACSPSVCLFRSYFRAKLSPQWQWKSFSPVCSLTCLFKLICPVNTFPQANTQSPFHHTVP